MPRFSWPYTLSAALYCAGIFLLSAQPSLPDRAPGWLDFPGADKVAHTLLYAGLGMLVYVGLVRSDESVGRAVRTLAPVIFATVYGMSDEIHQLFVPNRSFDLFDLLADTVGATIGVAALETLCRRRGIGGTLARRRP